MLIFWRNLFKEVAGKYSLRCLQIMINSLDKLLNSGVFDGYQK